MEMQESGSPGAYGQDDDVQFLGHHNSTRSRMRSYKQSSPFESDEESEDEDTQATGRNQKTARNQTKKARKSHRKKIIPALEE